MSNGALKVLVVDDEPMLGDLLAAILESTGCETVIASDGNDGLRLARTMNPAMIFCDISMPGLTGEEVLRTLRSDPVTAGLPVVLMSGHESPNVRTADADADAFLAKPFSPNAVLHLVHSLGGAANPAAGSLAA